MSQKRQRRALSGDEKMGILREHLVEGRPVSELCDKHNLQPTQVYQWLKRLFEEGGIVFDRPGRKSTRQQSAEQKELERLKAKLRDKNDVMAELMGEHIDLKKKLGEI